MFVKNSVIGAAALSLAMCAVTAQATLLDDGGFDLATSGGTVSNSDWVLTASTPDGTNLAAQFQTGFANADNTGVGGSQPPGTGTGVWFRSFEGNQGGTGEPLAQADITQTVIAPVSGDYMLTFVAGRETNFTAEEFAVTLFSSGTGGSAIVDLLTALIPDGNLGGAASGNPGGTMFSLNLLGVTAGDMLTVSGLMVNGADSQIPGGQSAFLDSFSLTSVSAVPVPASLALFALGLFAFGARRTR